MRVFYYLINNQIMKGEQKPRPMRGDIDFKSIYERWKSSLQKCSITENELEKVRNKSYVNYFVNIFPDGKIRPSIEQLDKYHSIQIEVTDIINDNNEVITFKEN